MGRFDKLATLNYINLNKLVLNFYHPDIEIVKNVTKACHEGGIRIFEFTNRGDFAWEVFKDLEIYCRQSLPDMILGTGSILDPSLANLYISLGSNFIVGPVTNSEVAKTCNRKQIPYIPGCLTPSEISVAEELGCYIVKVFPNSVVGPSFVQSLLAPMPWARILPTGDIDMDPKSLNDWLEAGVFAIGMGSKLFTEEIISQQNWELLTKNCKKLTKMIINISSGINGKNS
jgi:2-dehydro-3-deoxyphosphogluconate aldolase/(4S)-4-hydroxy-2-oxoglutarate aldolase